MTPTDPFVTRHGYKQKRSSGGAFVFLLGIGVLVAGASVVGIRYGRTEPSPHAPVGRSDTPLDEPSARTELTSTEAPPAEIVAEPSAAPPPPEPVVPSARPRAQAPARVKEAPKPTPPAEPAPDPFSTTQ